MSKIPIFHEIKTQLWHQNRATISARWRHYVKVRTKIVLAQFTFWSKATSVAQFVNDTEGKSGLKNQQHTGNSSSSQRPSPFKLRVLVSPDQANAQPHSLPLLSDPKNRRKREKWSLPVAKTQFSLENASMKHTWVKKHPKCWLFSSFLSFIYEIVFSKKPKYLGKPELLISPGRPQPRVEWR